jgi:hypothetical protein
MQGVRSGLFSWLSWVLGVPGLLPAPDCCRVWRAGGRVKDRAEPGRAAAPRGASLTRPPGSADHAGGRGGEDTGVFGCVSGSVRAFLSSSGDQLVTPRSGGWEQPALPGSAGRCYCPGDMMIDWVSPACGDAAAQSYQAARLAVVARATAGSGWQRLGGSWPRLFPHRVNVAAGSPARTWEVAVLGHHGTPLGFRRR